MTPIERLRRLTTARTASPAAPPTAPPTAPPRPTLDEQRTANRDRAAASDARRDLKRALERIDDLDTTVRAYERYTSEPIRPVPPAVLAMTGGRRVAAAVAMLSDVHAEERVDRTDAIDNEYSLSIAQRRVARFFAGLVWLVQHNSAAFDIGTVVVWLGGDLITGDIHDELLERAEVPPGEATMIVRDWIVSGLRYLLAELPDVTVLVPCSIGNHGRTTKRMNAATGYGHSWEWLLYQMIGRDFANEPRVQIHTTRDEMQYLSVLGYELAFHHGHRLRYNGGIGGLTIPAIKAMHRWSQWRDCDYYHFGHFHTYSPDIASMTFNGSVIGPNPYAFAIGAKPEPPQQAFYLLDAKRGKTAMHPIWVGES